MLFALLKRSIQLSVILLATVPADTLASGILPSASSLQIVSTSDARYQAATAKAQEALYVQTGVAQRYDLLASFIDDKMNKVQLKLMCELEEFSPVNTKIIVVVGGVIYSAIYEKQLSRNFKNPWLPLTHSVALSRDSGSTSIQLMF